MSTCDHHWTENEDREFPDEPEYACDHCGAQADKCPECHGLKGDRAGECRTCHGEGVVRATDLIASCGMWLEPSRHSVGERVDYFTGVIRKDAK